MTKQTGAPGRIRGGQAQHTTDQEQHAMTDHRPPCTDGDHCGELHCPTPAPRRRLTEQEHDQAWHAIEGANTNSGPDPDTVLNAVLAALRIDPPRATEKPRCTCARSWNLHSRDCARYTDGHELINRASRFRQDDDALCGHCGVPKGSHHHPWTSTTDTIASAP